MLLKESMYTVSSLQDKLRETPQCCAFLFLPLPPPPEKATSLTQAQRAHKASSDALGLLGSSSFSVLYTSMYVPNIDKQVNPWSHRDCRSLWFSLEYVPSPPPSKVFCADFVLKFCLAVHPGTGHLWMLIGGCLHSKGIHIRNSRWDTLSSCRWLS